MHILKRVTHRRGPSINFSVVFPFFFLSFFLLATTMPRFTDNSQKRAIPIALILFFIILVNLLMIYRYIPSNRPDLNKPPQRNPPQLPDYDPPQYGLKLVRPKPSERKFKSQMLEDYIDSLEPEMKDSDLYVLLQNCLPNTLDTTVEWAIKEDPRTFLITGDSKKKKVLVLKNAFLIFFYNIVPAMWIRDSTNQIAPYLRFLNQDETLRDLVFGVLQVQASFLNYDPYANAFLRPWYAPKKQGQKRGSTSDRVVPSYDPDIVWESKV
jgi:hypothetical protein